MSASESHLVSVGQAQAADGREQLIGLIANPDTDLRRTSVLPLVGTLHAGLGPTMPEDNPQILQALHHESRPLPAIFRGKPISCTDWQVSSHHRVAVQAGVWPIVQPDALA